MWDAKGIAEGLTQRLLRRAATLRPMRPPATVRARCIPAARRGLRWTASGSARSARFTRTSLDAFEIGEDAVVRRARPRGAAGARASRRPGSLPLPRFPASARDLAVVVRDDVAAGDVEHAARDAAGDLAEEVSLFDRFVGGNVPAGHASLALHVVYRAPDRTLTDAEVDARHAQVRRRARKTFRRELARGV